jgi:hypothetical protein
MFQNNSIFVAKFAKLFCKNSKQLWLKPNYDLFLSLKM